MSPLLFVILLGLLAGFVLFLLVTGAGALLSSLMNRRRERRFASAQAPAAREEFDEVLTAEQPVPAAEDQAPAPEIEHAPEQASASPRRKLGFPHRAARQQKPAAEVDKGDVEQAGASAPAMELTPEQDEQLAVGIASADEGRLHKATRRGRHRAEVVEPEAETSQKTPAEVQAPAGDEEPEPEHKVRARLAPLFPHRQAPERHAEVAAETPAAEPEQPAEVEPEVEPAPAAAQAEPERTPEAMAPAEPSRRPGLFPARRPQPEPAAEPEPEVAPEPEVKQPEPADPFAAVLAALNKR